jgi:hypothetical protein
VPDFCSGISGGIIGDWGSPRLRSPITSSGFTSQRSKDIINARETQAGLTAIRRASSRSADLRWKGRTNGATCRLPLMWRPYATFNRRTL